MLRMPHRARAHRPDRHGGSKADAGRARRADRARRRCRQARPRCRATITFPRRRPARTPHRDPSRRSANFDGRPIPDTPCPLLPHDVVRFAGQAVAMVVAETLAQAKDAAEAIEVEYEPLPVLVDARVAVKPDAPLLYPAPRLQRRRRGADGRPGRHRGGVRQGRPRRAASRPRSSASPACRWSRARCVGWFEPDTGRYILHAGSGGIVRQKREIAAILGVAARQGARHRRRHRRQLRHAQLAVPGVSAGRVGRAPHRPAGEVDRGAHGIVPVRPPGPRPGLASPSWRSTRTAAFSRCASIRYPTSAAMRPRWCRCARA